MTVYTLLISSELGTQHRVEVAASRRAAIERAKVIAAEVAGEWAGPVKVWNRRRYAPLGGGVVVETDERYVRVARPESMDGVSIERVEVQE